MSFQSVKEFISKTDTSLAEYNQEAASFEWTRFKVITKTFAGKNSGLLEQTLGNVTVQAQGVKDLRPLQDSKWSAIDRHFGGLPCGSGGSSVYPLLGG